MNAKNGGAARIENCISLFFPLLRSTSCWDSAALILLVASESQTATVNKQDYPFGHASKSYHIGAGRGEKRNRVLAVAGRPRPRRRRPWWLSTAPFSSFSLFILSNKSFYFSLRLTVDFLLRRQCRFMCRGRKEIIRTNRREACDWVKYYPPLDTNHRQIYSGKKKTALFYYSLRAIQLPQFLLRLSTSNPRWNSVEGFRVETKRSATEIKDLVQTRKRGSGGLAGCLYAKRFRFFFLVHTQIVSPGCKEAPVAARGCDSASSRGWTQFHQWHRAPSRQLLPALRWDVVRARRP